MMDAELLALLADLSKAEWSALEKCVGGFVVSLGTRESMACGALADLGLARLAGPKGNLERYVATAKGATLLRRRRGS